MGWGSIAQWLTDLLPDSVPWVRLPAFSEEKIVDGAEVNQHPWLEESGRRFENVD